MMSIMKRILDRWRYQQIEVKTEIVVNSFLIPVGCLIDTGWDIFRKRETVPVVVRVLFCFMFIITSTSTGVLRSIYF
jgi:hypothetical protein